MSLSETVGTIDRLSEDERGCIEICHEAAQVWEWCADECRQHDADHCQTCADVVAECAEHCRTM